MKSQDKKHSWTAVFRSPQEVLSLVDCEIPELKEKEILIRNEYTTLCRSDLNTFSGKRSEKCPTILGHEIVGRIAAFGEGALRQDSRGCHLSIGERITWSIFASDPASEMSRIGIPQKAEGLFKYGHEKLTENSTLHGGLSQYCILRPNTAVIRIDETIPLKVAATINCAGATVAGALRLAGAVNGKTVAVSGVGMLGIYTCAMCRAAGAERIIAIDINEERLETARLFGADETWLIPADKSPDQELNRLSRNAGSVHIVFELSGVAKAMESTLALLSIGGTAVWIGATFPQREVHLNAESIVRRLLTLKGLHNYNQQDLTAAVEFIEKHHASFPFANLIYDGFSLEQAQEAFNYALESDVYRVGIRIGRSQ
jgi:putative phosphonate catabolism associated alcohol dehydrogenase